MHITNRQGVRLTSLVVPKAHQAHRNSINIEFKAWVDHTCKDILKKQECLVSPSEFSNIILLHKSPFRNSDLMYAYDGNVNDGCVYIGNWNDGTF